MRRFLLPCLVGLILLAAPSVGTARTIKSIWGPVTLPNGQPAGPVYKALGVDDLQEHLLWNNVAPTKPADPRNPADPAYHWPAELNAAVFQGQVFGFSVSVQVQGSPPWANGGRPSRWAPNNPRDYADFVFAASQRYPTIRRWMIWGEPGRAPNWQPLPRNKPTAPRRYARLLDAAYGQLKFSNPRNIVIGGMTFTVGDVKPRDWVRWMRLPNGKPPRLDMWGHNPFSTRIPNLKNKPLAPGDYDFSDMGRLYKKVHHVYAKAYPRKFKRSGPRIWASEFTIQADHGSKDFNFFVSKATQARWIRAAYRQANKHSFISGVGWLGLLDEPIAPFNRTTGLLTFGLQKKPAYLAYQRAK